MTEKFWPKNEEEFIQYVRTEMNKQHDYNTSAEAVSNITVAAFNYVASTMGITGFQAGWAGLNAIGKIRSIEGPFAIIDGEKFLYPQYDLHKNLHEWHEEWKPALSKLAKERLKENGDFIHPKVKERFEYYANLEFPESEGTQ